jgi:SAM-dependent methyltransferase
MQLKYLLTLVRMPKFFSLLRIMQDWRAFIRMHFIHAALDTGLLDALDRPRSRDELIRALEVKRTDILDALLDIGLATEELAQRNGKYRIRGRRSRSVVGGDGDTLAAVIQANVTYYNAVYREAAARLRGAPSGDHLGHIGELVARFSKLGEPLIERFIADTVRDRPRMRILELGCGSGVHLRNARNANANAVGVGIDMDEHVVRQARENMQKWGLGSEFKILQGDIRNPSEDLDGPFDLITMYNLLYYFPIEDRPTLFRSLKQRLSETGVLAIFNNMHGRGRDPFAANLNLATTSFTGCTPLPDEDETRQQLEQSGFTKITVTKLIPGRAFCGILSR